MKKRKDRTPFYLLIVALLLAGLAYRIGGFDLVWAGMRSGGMVLVSVIPLLVAAFLVAGLTQTLVTKEFVSRWLGAASGWRGIALACLGGALIPGGPYAYYPIAAVLFQAGAGIGVMVAFITAKNLWSVSRLPVEFALLGPELTLTRFAATFLIPPLLGALTEYLFGRFSDRIRQGSKTA
jgi:uncharacterized membrane protein YraQ (UPF0718 family)